MVRLAPTLAASLALLPVLAAAHDVKPLHKRGAALRARQHASSASSSGSASASGRHTAVSATATSAVASSAAVSGAAAAPTTSGPPVNLNPSESAAVATISSGTYSQATTTLATTYTAGATPPVSGAPPLPTGVINPANYPPLDKVPPVDSDVVQQWLKKIDMSKIPNLSQTVDGSCASDPALVADQSRCWWTCGGCTAKTDIVACPDKNHWGLSYDDGPSPYTPSLIRYLEQHDLKSTFFIVGSRAISRPDMLQYEYMTGHQLSVHTWSHPPLTTLTNEQIVAELAWTMKALKDLTGVTPNTMRPPYGDIDNRVRAICMAMGLTPVIWTSAPGGKTFDTQDWQVQSGLVSAATVVSNFDAIMTNASNINTGFIVLEHDLYQQSVDLAVSVILPNALSRTPKLTIQSVIDCMGQPLSNAYIETNPNTTNSSPSSVGNTGSSSSSSGKNGAAAAAAGLDGHGVRSTLGAAAVAVVAGAVAAAL